MPCPKKGEELAPTTRLYFRDINEGFINNIVLNQCKRDQRWTIKCEKAAH